MAAPALLSLSPAVSRRPHLLFSHTHSPRHLRLAPPAASSSPSPSPGGGGGVFLSPSALSKLDALAAFRYAHSFPHGSLTVRALTPEDDAEADALVRLLADSFSEDVRWAPAQRYAQLLAFVIRRYLHERRGLTPHAAVLVGFYKPAAAEAGQEGEDGEDEGEMACTAEVSLDAVGAPGAPPTPTPPLDFPYICNMTVKTSFRRRGIGKQLLKACEDLVVKMDAKTRVYLHCRIIDQVPFNMYKKAGYTIVQTDSIFVWLSLQKRKHLMRKELPQVSVDSECTPVEFDDNILTG
uniref:Uncharacterized protein n=2 Tax=Avena sativa TaxID=4498 RepID=A0ACD5URB5_AVESA